MHRRDDWVVMMGQLFNACDYLLDRRLRAGDGDRVAVAGAFTGTGPGGNGPAREISYAQLHDWVCRTAAGLRAVGLLPEQRLLMVMADSPEFVVTYLAAMRIGAIPVPVSTMLRAEGIGELLRDSRARLLAFTREFAAAALAAAAAAPELAGLVDASPTALELTGLAIPVHSLLDLATMAPDESVYDTPADAPAFWLYTSGTTGQPKGAMHRHGSVRVVCETYATQVLGIRPEDRCLSAAKAFFAYGLGNSVLFPLSAGAAAVLNAPPSAPEAMSEVAATFGATLFFAGPTFFASMLRAGLAGDALAGVRLAASAGEALPASLYERWTARFGVDIIDGIGMTEMLHIFLSNYPGQVRAGTTGKAVPGYDLRLIDEEVGQEAGDDTPATLFVRGESAATGYWSRYDISRQVFQGEWLRTGDTYVRDGDGYYTCLGRTGDMIKASGIWVSPMEVEDRLLAHPAVSQAVVIAAPDPDGLEKPVAYVIPAPGQAPGQTVTEAELIEYCRQGLPSFKRPRKVIFTDSFPATATGKVRRVELRAMAATVLL
jgi:benzoate-CoA ligase family protein